VRTYLIADEMPRWLGAAVGAVWADLQSDGLLSEIEPCASTGDADFPGMFWIGLCPTSAPDRQSISGVGVSEEDSAALILVTIADDLQNVVSEMPGAWGQARPRCPKHPHPLKPVVIDQQAWWTCELDAERLARIGAGELTRSHSRGDR
jgi:hypothetical protein